MSRKHRNPSGKTYKGSGNLALQKRRYGQRGSPERTDPDGQARGRAPAPFIHWKGCQAEQIVLRLRIQGRAVRPETPFQHQMAVEFQELLRRLFSQAEALLVEPLSPGFSHAGVVKVQPSYASGGLAQPVVVKFGDVQVITQEYKHYQEHVQRFIGDGRRTLLLDHRSTVHLGGIVYSFLGTTPQTMQSFASFYQHASGEMIKQTLDILFRSTCRLWYANHSSLQLLNLTEEYQKQTSYTREQLQRSIGARLPGILDQKDLCFQSLSSEQVRSFSNPFTSLPMVQPQIHPTYVSTTHGDFNPRNIFVDQTGYPWLIDFQNTGPSHILRDVATLDAVIRLQLLTAEEATLDERLALEEALCGVEHFSQLDQLKKPFAHANSALSKAWETIVHLRSIAYWLIEKKPSHEMREYYAALLYVTMNTLSFSSLEIEQCEHALISACLLMNALQ